MTTSFFVRQILSGNTLGRALFNDEVMQQGRTFSGRVLDLAGGTGSYLSLLPRGLEVVRTDAHEAPGIEAVDFNKPLPFPNGSFNHVLLMNALYIVEDPQRLLSEIRRVLKGGGTAIIASPFLQNEMRGPHDYRRLTSEGLDVLFRASGFTAIEITPYGERFSVAAHLLHPFFCFSIVRLPFYALALALDRLVPRHVQAMHPAPLGYFCILK